MAVLTGVPGLEVYIAVVGATSPPEYPHPQPDPNPRKLKKYIETVPGMEFAVVWRYRLDKLLLVKRWIDGQLVEGQIYQPCPCSSCSSPTSSPHYRILWGRFVERDGGGCQMQATHFSPLETDSDTDNSNVAGIGEIVVQFLFLESVTYNAGPFIPSPNTQTKLVSETALKGKWVSQCVSYQPLPEFPVPTSAPSVVLLREPHVATFTFLYRTRNELEMLGIVPEKDPQTAFAAVNIDGGQSSSSSPGYSVTRIPPLIRVPPHRGPSGIFHSGGLAIKWPTPNASLATGSLTEKQDSKSHSQIETPLPTGPSCAVDSTHASHSDVPSSDIQRNLKREAIGHSRDNSGASDADVGVLKTTKKKQRRDSSESP